MLKPELYGIIKQTINNDIQNRSVKKIVYFIKLETNMWANKKTRKICITERHVIAIVSDNFVINIVDSKSGSIYDQTIDDNLQRTVHILQYDTKYVSIITWSKLWYLQYGCLLNLIACQEFTNLQLLI